MLTPKWSAPTIQFCSVHRFFTLIAALNTHCGCVDQVVLSANTADFACTVHSMEPVYRIIESFFVHVLVRCSERVELLNLFRMLLAVLTSTTWLSLDHSVPCCLFRCVACERLRVAKSAHVGDSLCRSARPCFLDTLLVRCQHLSRRGLSHS